MEYEELIVAEKPKVAEKIAEAIGDKVTKKSYKNVPYYEVEMGKKTSVVAPAVGHVFTLVEKEKTRTYPIFDIEWVPAYEANPKKAAYTKEYVTTLEKLSKNAKCFVSACDYDVEGSTIAYNVFRFATAIKEGRRMKFSALTKEDLYDAYENQSDFDYFNAYAGETRHILDWYYGINLSRALMASMKAASRYRVLSIGRVQGPALSILADLEKSIRAFVPSPYWEVGIKVKEIEFQNTKGRFKEAQEAENALNSIKENGVVCEVEKKEQKIAPSPNFDLTSLQVEAYRLFKFEPSRVLSLAQNLYEASLITYPRTSSQKIPPSINVSQIVQALTKSSDYGTNAKKAVQNQWYTPIQGKKEDPAHPAIHPTGQIGKVDDISEKKLYDLIVRRFLASLAPEAKRERMRIEIESGGEKFSASGGRVTEKGWIEFYGDYYTTEDIELPKFEKGEKVKIEDRKIEKKETKPPKRYTQTSLVSELESRQLGTKSTRAVVVDTLFKRGYVDGKSLEVSDFGLKISEVLQKYAPEICDENLTRKIEDDMELIALGKKDKEETIKDAKEILTNTLEKWKKNESQIGDELLKALKYTEHQESIVGQCDKCSNKLRYIRMRDGRQFIGCYGYPNCKNTYPLPHQAIIKTTDKLCPDCQKPTVNVKKGKMRYTMCIDPKCPSKLKWKKSDANEKNIASTSQVQENTN